MNRAAKGAQMKHISDCVLWSYAGEQETVQEELYRSEWDQHNTHQIKQVVLEVKEDGWQGARGRHVGLRTAAWTSLRHPCRCWASPPWCCVAVLVTRRRCSFCSVLVEEIATERLRKIGVVALRLVGTLPRPVTLLPSTT